MSQPPAGPRLLDPSRLLPDLLLALWVLLIAGLYLARGLAP